MFLFLGGTNSHIGKDFAPAPAALAFDLAPAAALALPPVLLFILLLLTLLLLLLPLTSMTLALTFPLLEYVVESGDDFSRSSHKVVLITNWEGN